MKVYRVTGTFEMGRERHQPFTKEIAADDEERAREILLSDLGSKHGTTRRRITIASVVEVPPDQVRDPLARAKAGMSG